MNRKLQTGESATHTHVEALTTLFHTLKLDVYLLIVVILKKDRMHPAVVFALLTACVMADAVEPPRFSFSPAVGSGSGSSYTLTGDARITAIRVWEAYSNYIYGFQVRYGFIWSHVAGHQYGTPLEMELFDGEAITQISGKYAHYLQSVAFITNRGRSLFAGQPTGHSFNMYPSHPDAELRFISGRVHGGITSIAAHWAVFETESANGH